MAVIDDELERIAPDGYAYAMLLDMRRRIDTNRRSCDKKGRRHDQPDGHYHERSVTARRRCHYDIADRAGRS